jgi:serine phosphatase RsbU (regulator of sigma subunit)
LLAALALCALDGAGAPVPERLSGLAWLLLVAYGTYAAFRFAGWVAGRLFWRIRTKLIVSYLFIALVPVLLLTAFFLLAGLLGITLVTSSIASMQLQDEAEQLRALARATLGGLPADEVARERYLPRQLARIAELHPGMRHALLDGGRVVSAAGIVSASRPPWLEGPGFAGRTRLEDGEDVLRGLWSEGDAMLVLDVPLQAAVLRRVEDRTGIRILRKNAAGTNGDARETASRPSPGDDKGGLNAPAILPLTRWADGELEIEPLALRFHPREVLARLSPAPVGAAAPDILVALLTVVGATFLVLYSGALVLGLLLARSITRSVHALSRGTERLRKGDFSQPIPVQSRDQLGELAESFNTMAREIQQLLLESAEKQRLEEELRIARQIQMSLLPPETAGLPGLRVSALCLPAEEVGGDYYDLLPLSETRMAVVVADVSGKGTSAALYMAELKGLVLSLSRVYDSPARLLCEANRILAANMDSRSFITMTYALVDTDARGMRFARAGHNPIIHLEAATRRSRVLAPPGMGLGLDPGPRFEQVLQEREVPLLSGDVLVFFTDGLSEAMNARAEIFGERRLRELVERSDSLAAEGIKQAILFEVRAFVGNQAPHDDMTLVVLKVA